MNRKEKAHIREALRCLREIKKNLATQGNLFLVLGCDTPGTRNAHERRVKIDKAIEYLEEMINPKEETNG